MLSPNYDTSEVMGMGWYYSMMEEPSTHEDHKEEGLVEINAIDEPDEYLCCVDEFEAMVEKGDACPKHPFKYCEDGVCERCEEIEELEKTRIASNGEGAIQITTFGVVGEVDND